MGKRGKVPPTKSKPKKVKKPDKVALVPYKYLITPIVQQVNAKGKPIGEHPIGTRNNQPIEVFDHELADWTRNFRKRVSEGTFNVAPAPQMAPPGIPE